MQRWARCSRNTERCWTGSAPASRTRPRCCYGGADDGALPETQPQIAKIIERTGLDYLANPDGLAPRARRDLKRAQAGLVRRRYGRGTRVHRGRRVGVLHLASATGAGPRAIDRAADQLAVNLLLCALLRIVVHAVDTPSGA